MKSGFSILIFVFLVICLNPLKAQPPDLIITRNLDKVDVPFEYINNFIVVKILFNDIFPLKFILDTGAEHSILTKREITDLMQVNYQRRFPILGADLKTELYAYLATGIRMKMNNLYFTNYPILVLEDDYFRFEEYAGIDVHGIIGADILRRFVIKINFDRQTITFYDPSVFKAPNSKFEIPKVWFKRSKPYIFSNIKLDNGKSVPVKLLMDTGASLSLMIHTNTDSLLEVPDHVVRSNIGMGLGGYLEGVIGRIPELNLCENIYLNGVTTNFQDIQNVIDTIYLNGRNGIVGNQVLSRFTMIIDYNKEKIYLQPNKRFHQKFKYDRSGLSIISSGLSHNTFSVSYVVTGSPAQDAGIKVGDEIRNINGLPASIFNLEEVLYKLQGKIGKRIRLTLKRDGQRIKVSFRLRELI